MYTEWFRIPCKFDFIVTDLSKVLCVFAKYFREWEKEEYKAQQNGTRPSFLRTIMRAFGFGYSLLGTVALLHVSTRRGKMYIYWYHMFFPAHIVTQILSVVICFNVITHLSSSNQETSFKQWEETVINILPRFLDFLSNVLIIFILWKKLCHSSTCLITNYYQILQDLLKLAQPILLGQLVLYFVEDSPISTRDAYLYALGLSLFAFVSSIVNAPYSFMRQVYGMRMRVACTGLVYRKVSYMPRHLK